MNIDVVSETSRTVDIVGADESIKVVIITGAGEKSFCAGADISYMVNIDPITAEKYASSAQSVLNKIERLDKPVIGNINGYALGGGCELAMVCDIRIASSNAKLGQPEVTIGIPPGWGGTKIDEVSRTRKSKGTSFYGQDGLCGGFQLGLVNSVIKLTSDDNLPTEVAKDDKEKQKERNNQIAKLLNNKT